MSQKKERLVLSIAKTLYVSTLRDLLVSAVKSTETDIDDFLLGLCDKVFDVKEDDVGDGIMPSADNSISKNM